MKFEPQERGGGALSEDCVLSNQPTLCTVDLLTASAENVIIRVAAQVSEIVTASVNLICHGFNFKCTICSLSFFRRPLSNVQKSKNLCCLDRIYILELTLLCSGSFVQ